MKRAPVVLLLLLPLVLLHHSLRAEEKVPAAAETASARTEVIELPKFVVTDSREFPPPESWRYGTIAGFEILSNASEKATKRLIGDFELFRTALGYVWNVAPRASAPTPLIVCGRGGKFDQFEPAGKSLGADAARASLFLQDHNRSAIVIDFEAKVLNVLSTGDDDPASGTDSSRIDVDHNKQLYREYVRFLLSQAEPRLPAWFEEGMAQIVMAMKFDRRSIIVGKLEDPNTVSAEAYMIAQANSAASAAGADDGASFSLAGAPAEDLDFNAALRRKALVPMEKFFAVTPDSPEAQNPLGNNRWAKQAYAFVHLCIYGENGKWQKPFANFVLRLTKEPVSEALFKDCFKMSYRDFLIHLRGYIEFTNYNDREFYAKKGEPGLAEPTPLVLRDATQSEVGRLKGEALLLGGHKDAARREFAAPYIRGERDPRLLATLGLFDHAEGEDVRARKFLEAAVAAKVDRPEAYLELARYRFAEALAKPGAGDGAFSAAQSGAIVGLLLAARKLPPPTNATYDLLAETWGRSPTKPTKDDLRVLVEGVQLYPGRLKLVFQTAALCSEAGILDAAHSLADHGIRYAPDPTVKARFEKLKATFPPLPPETAKAETAARK